MESGPLKSQPQETAKMTTQETLYPAKEVKSIKELVHNNELQYFSHILIAFTPYYLSSINPLQIEMQRIMQFLIFYSKKYVLLVEMEKIKVSQNFSATSFNFICEIKIEGCDEHETSMQ